MSDSGGKVGLSRTLRGTSVKQFHMKSILFPHRKTFQPLRGNPCRILHVVLPVELAISEVKGQVGLQISTLVLENVDKIPKYFANRCSLVLVVLSQCTAFTQDRLRDTVKP